MKNTALLLMRNFCVVFAIACGIAQSVPAKADLIALALPGITGNVTAAGYQGTIEVLSLTGNIDVSEPTIGGGSTTGQTTGQPTFGDLMIHKRFDMASPALFLALVKGTRLSSAVLTFLQTTANGQLQKIFTMTLSNVILTKFATDATEPHVLAGPEQINLFYSKIILKDEGTITLDQRRRTTPM
jgi:type VI secretion system secreted protein Hcp